MKLDVGLVTRLARLGLSSAQIETLARCERTLQRWAERECNGDIQWNDAGDTCTDRYGNRIPNREAGALARARKALEGTPLHLYHQTDPRGCMLYLYNPSDLGTSPIDSVYSSLGVAVCS